MDLMNQMDEESEGTGGWKLWKANIEGVRQGASHGGHASAFVNSGWRAKLRAGKTNAVRYFCLSNIVRLDCGVVESLIATKTCERCRVVRKRNETRRPEPWSVENDRYSESPPPCPKVEHSGNRADGAVLHCLQTLQYRYYAT
ncbi:hypothetical protein G5I_13639 [Acromyrmex echinatior]|uniref:Uncharacterized protein n=1 Tax=Acromyrmex echinatior TaxID=103372 RepID=F4X5K5_ACREC|nr:hypothetical protein G5I_13639 [Acromyrmex echinatior]